MFVERELSAHAISIQNGGKPSVQTVLNWAEKKDKSGKSWNDYRQERIDQMYLEMSPQNMANQILKRIWDLLNGPWTTSKEADQLVKLQSSMEKLTKPELQIPVMYQMLMDFVLYCKKNEPSIVDDKLLQAVQGFKNHIRARLINDFS
jgi:hypothetical protein